MTGLFQALNEAQHANQKQSFLKLKQELAVAGLLNHDKCPGCSGEALVLARVVADPKRNGSMFELIKIDDQPSRTPVAIVCADCGRVTGLLVRDRIGFESGARIAELSAFK